MAKPKSWDENELVALANNGEGNKAWKIVGSALMEDPNDVRALVTASYVMQRLGELPQAYHFAKSAVSIWPKNCAAWTNFGHAASLLSLVEEAEQAYLKAIYLAQSEVQTKNLYVNLSALYIDAGHFDEAEVIAHKALALDPASKNAQANVGFCKLAKRDWSGWAGYRLTIGSPWRPKVQYGDEPEWDGTPGKTVALYEDQGLGDAISFASMLPDAIAISSKVILDCDERLENLFRRSFPQARVYGTRRYAKKWAVEDRQIDASLPLGQIGEYFRTCEADFPGTPYLVPCPIRTAMWKAQFAGRPTIGVAWTGGVAKTNERNRQLTLEELAPLFALDARFVSLQYRKTDVGSSPIIEYPWATLSEDYDDTAALIASLDYVLCIQTAVAHTAGALGVPVTVLVPEATQWRYGKSQISIPWYRSLNVIRQKKTGSWRDEIECAVKRVADHLGQLPGRAGTSACDNQLRDGEHPIRTAGLANRQPNGHHAPA